MKNAKLKIEKRRSEIRSRLGEISVLTGDALTADIQAERDGLQVELTDSEPQLRAAIEAEQIETREAVNASGMTAEELERVELRDKAKLGLYIVAALRGRAVTGAEAELQEAAGVDGIPLELWDYASPRRAPRRHAVTGDSRDQSRSHSSSDLRTLDRGSIDDRNADGSERHLRNSYDRH